MLVRRAALAAPAAGRHPAPRRRRAGRRARRRRLARRVGDAARRCSAARSSPRPDHRAARRAARPRRPDGRDPRRGAGDDVRAEQRAMAELAGADARRRLPRRCRRLSSTAPLAGAVRTRCAAGGLRDPRRHRRPADRRAAPRRPAAAACSGPRSAPRPPTLWSRLRRAARRATSTSSAWDLPGPRRTTAPCPRSRSRWPSWPPACSRSSTTSWRSAATGRRSPTPATRSAARSGCSCCSTRPTGSSAAALLCTGARIGDAGERGPSGSARSAPRGRRCWSAASAERWFAPGFVEREPDAWPALLHALHDADDEGYAAGLRRAGRASTSATGWPRSPHPVLAVAGADDLVTPAERLREIADGVPGRPARRARRRRPPGAGRGPDEVAGADRAATSSASRLHVATTTSATAGMAVRREVLGDAHVDRAIAGTTDLTRGLPGAYHARTPGARSGPGPAWTAAAAR